MKNSKINFATIAIVLGIGVAFTQSAFTPVKKNISKLSGSEYVFNGSTLAEDKMAGEYSPFTSDPGCDGADVLPCVISVPAGTTLTAWLAARTDTEILSQSIEKRDNN